MSKFEEVHLKSDLTGESATQGLLDWLNEKRLIQSIIELLDPSRDRDTHDNASRLLIEVSACPLNFFNSNPSFPRKK